MGARPHVGREHQKPHRICSHTAFRTKEIKGVTHETTMVNGNNKRKNMLVNTVNNNPLLHAKI